MKQKFLCTLVSLLLLVTMLPILPASATATNDGWWFEDFSYADGETTAGDQLPRLTMGNSSETFDSKIPLNNLYDAGITNDGASVSIQEKSSLGLVGDYSEVYKGGISKRCLLYANEQGLITLVPGTVMKGKTAFTVSYIQRHYKPTAGGAFGLALFYGNAVTANGDAAVVDGAYVSGNAYFNGYDNYTFTGFTGSKMSTYSAYSVYDGETTKYANDVSLPSSASDANANNKAVFVSVTCTKGEWTVGDKTYTARIDTYVDTHYLVTSYAQWVDGAPIMLYCNVAKDTNSTYHVGVTDIRVQASTHDTGITLKGHQLAEGSDDTYDVRFVATVDSTKYAEVGFDIYATYSAGDLAGDTYLYSKGSTTVYSALTATSKTGATGGDLEYITAGSQNGVYLAALAIHNIPTSAGTATFTVYPYYKNIGSNKKVVAETGGKFVFEKGVYNATLSGVAQKYKIMSYNIAGYIIMFF